MACTTGSLRTFRCVFIACFLQLSSGYFISYTSSALPNMNSGRNGFNFTAEQQSWIASIAAIGGIFGALLCGHIIEKFGRKLSMVLVPVPFVTSWVMILCTNGIALLMVGRFLGGMCVSFSSIVIPGYIAEIVKPKLRNEFSVIFPAFFCGGQLLVLISGAYLSWRYLAVVAIALLLLAILLLPFIVESPRWLLLNGYVEIAEENLNWLRCDSDEFQEELEAMKESLKNASSTFNFKELRSRIIYKPLLISMAIVFFQVFTSINYVWFYCQTIFESTGTEIDAHLESIVIGVVGLLGTLLSAFFLKHVHPRNALIYTGISIILSLTALGGFFLAKNFYPYLAENVLFWLPLTSLFVIQLSYALAWITVPAVIVNEILPNRARAWCSSVAHVTVWLCIFLSVKLPSYLQQFIHDCGLFWLYAAITCGGVIFVRLCIPDTRHKTLEEIEIELEFKHGGKATE